MNLGNAHKLIISIVIAFGVVCIVVASISIFKGCHHEPLSVFNPTPLQDTITTREKEMGKIIDSAISANNRQSKSVDSLKNITTQLQIQLDNRKQITENLSAAYKAYRLSHDTLNAFAKCDSLADENKELNKAVSDYEASNRKLYDSLQSIVGINSLIIAKKDYLYSTLRENFDSLVHQYALQSGTLQKVQKPKRWVIGPQIGVSYDGVVRVLPAIGISFAIIKF